MWADRGWGGGLIGWDLAGCGVGGYDFGMATDLESRRFTMSELLAYVSVFSVTLGLLRAVASGLEYSRPRLMVVGLALLHFGLVAILGSLVGVAIAMLLVGRGGVRRGALWGAVTIQVLLALWMFSADWVHT